MYPSVIGVPVPVATITSRLANRCRLPEVGTTFGRRDIEGGR
nr:hypothetical protein JVH1_5674 [Rhodococcus sp. JVH1]